MTVLTKFRPKEPLKYLKWYDILIVTIIMFGEFYYPIHATISTEFTASNASGPAVYGDDNVL